MNIRLNVVFLVMIGMLGFGCSFMERHGVNTATPMLKGVVDNLMKLESAELAKEGLPGQILLISALTEFSPKNSQLLALASQAYASYGLVVEWNDPGYAIELYDIGKKYGLRALCSNNRAFEKGLKKGEHVSDLVEKITKKDVPAAFWYGLNGGLRVILEMDSPYVLAGLGDITKIFERIIVLDDAYFYYSPHLFQGAYYAISGPMLGGGLEKAQKEFDAAFKKNQNTFLLAHVFYARYYAALALDEALFDKTVEYVLKTPTNVLPEARLANAIAKQKAEWLKANKGRFF
jgi:hypothetical protein